MSAILLKFIVILYFFFLFFYFSFTFIFPCSRKLFKEKRIISSYRRWILGGLGSAENLVPHGVCEWLIDGGPTEILVQQNYFNGAQLQTELLNVY